jgi:predicted  nucleic acid-binding Zn-ribbon protein
MTLATVALVLGMFANSIALIITIVKMTARISAHHAVTTERIHTLENQVNNDITGRRVVGEMRQDLAVIKSQISDIKSDLQNITNPKA